MGVYYAVVAYIAYADDITRRHRLLRIIRL